MMWPLLAPLTPAAALELFDGLDPVTPDEMLGSWRGEGFPTGHPLDGLLEAWHWQGKRFDSTEEVHPLVFRGRGAAEVCVNPALVPMALLRASWVGRLIPFGGLFPWLAPLVVTGHSAARLRSTLYRDKVSAAMIYDHLPIVDVFRRLDGERLLGVMDAKGMVQPFFFVLRRETGLSAAQGSISPAQRSSSVATCRATSPSSGPNASTGTSSPRASG